MRAGLMLAAGTVAAAAALSAAEPKLMPLHRGGAVSPSGPLVTADVNGDSRPELLSCTAGAAYALRRSATSHTFSPSWYSEPVRCTALAVGDRNGDGAPEVFVGTAAEDGSSWIRVFDPRTYGPPKFSFRMPTADTVESVAVGDADGDGLSEIVAVTLNAAYVIDAAAMTMQWEAAGKGGRGVFIANIDGDAAAEVVVNGTTGYVLDALAQAEEWSYSGGFGTPTIVANVDADPQAEIVSSRNVDKIVTLQGDTRAESTFGIDVWYPAAIVVGDGDQNGSPELIVASPTMRDTQGYSFSGGEYLWRNQSVPASQLAIADFDGNGKQELAWRHYESGLLSIAAAARGGESWSSDALNSRRGVGVIDDLDGDGRLEHVVGGTLVLDLATRALKGTFAGVDTSRLTFVSSGQLDDDPAREVLLYFGENVSGAHAILQAFDSATYQSQWTLTIASVQQPRTRFQHALAVANVDGDGRDEIVVGLHNGTVAVLNGATPVAQWLTPTLDDSAKSVALGDLDGNGALDLVVATSRSLYVFDLATGGQRTQIAFSPDKMPNEVAAKAGQFAVVHRPPGTTPAAHALSVFDGAALTESWTCTLGNGGMATEAAFRYASVAGQPRLVLGDQAGMLWIFRTDGGTCPTPDKSQLGFGTSISALQLIDTTGDGRNELLAMRPAMFDLSLLGAADELRGDVDLDGVVTDADIDALVAYFLGGAPGAPPGADVNADSRVAIDDLFHLIDYRRGTGSAPPP